MERGRKKVEKGRKEERRRIEEGKKNERQG